MKPKHSFPRIYHITDSYGRVMPDHNTFFDNIELNLENSMIYGQIYLRHVYLEMMDTHQKKFASIQNAIDYEVMGES